MKQAIVLFAIGMAAVFARSEFRRFNGLKFRHFEPPFFANLTDEAKKEFKEIFHNSELTIAEQEDRIEELAKQYGVEDEVAEFHANRTATKEETEKKVTELLPTLPEKYEELKAIFANKDQTREERNQALADFSKKNPEAARALFTIYGQLRFPHAGRFGGRFGHGPRRFHGRRFGGKHDVQQNETENL